MCGLVGKFYLKDNAPVAVGAIERMLLPIHHRGPDSTGCLTENGVGLGHRRLSIVDLGGGAQPMSNEDGTIWIAFNGEIYNFEELRKELVLRGHCFRSSADTEVIIHLYEDYGPGCLRFLHGMFAFAIWDRNNRRLLLARDRTGIKPIYFGVARDTLWFGSELKSLLADPDFPRDIDLTSFRRFLALKYLPGDETPFANVRKLLPGHYLLAEKGSYRVARYWDLEFTRDRWSMPFEEAVSELETLLEKTVRSHLMSDVPVGVLLSGGIDSSGILSLASLGTRDRLKTFTVGFNDPRVVDERPYARLVAERYGTVHHEITVSSADFWSFLPSYVWHMEEPVCQPPAVALYYVSKLAKEHVKVLLSGEGGDEAFGGYPNYPNMLRLKNWENRLGPFARPLGALSSYAAGVLHMHRVQRYANALGRPLSGQYLSRASYPSVYFQRHASDVFSRSFLDATGGPSFSRSLGNLFPDRKDLPLLDQMLYADTKTWLPDDLLVKADKITMANSVELRVPLLDHAVLEFAASLHPSYKVRNRETKRILKASLSKSLPPEILNRRKAGFPVPFASWLETDLAERVREVLLDPSTLRRNYFQSRSLERLLTRSAVTQDWSDQVFSLLVLEFWHRQFLDDRRGGSSALAFPQAQPPSATPRRAPSLAH